MINYVIVKREFEYNDEYYYSEGEGGVPISIHTNKEEAISKAKDLNVGYATGLNHEKYDALMNYVGYKTLDPTFCQEIFGIAEPNYDSPVIKKDLTSEDVNYVVDGGFYTVYEVDGHQSHKVWPGVRS